MPAPVSVIAISTILPGLDFRVLPAIGFVEIGVGGFDRQLAAFRHGVAGVDRNVEDRVLELLRIGVDGPQSAAATVSIWICSPSVDCSRSDMPMIILLASSGCGANGCWRAKARSRCVRMAARSAAAIAAFENRSMPKSPFLMRRLTRSMRAHDDAQHIVEVVRDAAGELTDRLHFLRLPELVFGLLRAGSLAR